MPATTRPENYIIDFDNTFTKVEGLDELANIALKGHPDRSSIVAQIRELTNRGMDGNMSFAESLKERITLLAAHEKHIKELVAFLQTKITDSFRRNKAFLTANKDHIYIVSSGFREFILPIVTGMGLREDHVFANEFEFDADGNIIGFDEQNLLASDGGKKKLVASLQLQGCTYAIGDGYTDYELKEAGLVDRFFAFTENIARKNVLELADDIVSSLDEFLLQHEM